VLAGSTQRLADHEAWFNKGDAAEFQGRAVRLASAVSLVTAIAPQIASFLPARCLPVRSPQVRLDLQHAVQEMRTTLLLI
jgi:hypothetical protein